MASVIRPVRPVAPSSANKLLQGLGQSLNRAAAAARPKPVATNPFWSQAIGKSWDPAAQKPPKPRPAPRPAAPMTPGQTPGTSATTAPQPSPTASQPSPLDSSYYANVASNQAKIDSQLNALNLQSSQGQTALQAALGNLTYQQPRDQLSLMQNANRGGSLYSTVYQGNLGNLNRTYLQRQTGLQQTYEQQQAARNAQAQSLLAGIPLFNDQEAAASAQRLIAQAQANPATGQVPVAPAASSAPLTLQPRGPRPAPPKSGGHYVNVGGVWQLIHAIGPGKWAPGPPPKPKAAPPRGRK
jgi:hypothetical protein